MAPSRGARPPPKGAKSSPKESGSKKQERKPPPKSPNSLLDEAPRDNAGDVPRALQQRILNIFREAFSDVLQGDIKTALQEVKGHLYNRDFAAAFGKDEYLEAYAARWSASRALAYTQIFLDVSDRILAAFGYGRLRVASIGGGAGAEITAWAAYWATAYEHTIFAPDEQPQEDGRLEIQAIDIASWQTVVDKLGAGITTAPMLSKYHSVAARAGNKALLPSELLETTFIQQDVLADSAATFKSLGQSQVVTIMFTLNELYSTSVAKTQALLLSLSARLYKGCILLVVDSPGSYSTVNLNGAEKDYPMSWLLDHALLDQAEKAAGQPIWTKLISDNSRWFRLPEGLQYPIELENMRYQIHLYKKVG